VLLQLFVDEVEKLCGRDMLEVRIVEANEPLEDFLVCVLLSLVVGLFRNLNTLFIELH
jgi:hypothetical protein